jgi:16S rRNA (guanine527-N7)-methyltransferase
LTQPVEFDAILRKNGITLTENQNDSLQLYVALLLEWNSRINLISRRDQENVWTSHILHCLAPLMLLKIPSGAEVLDIGTGGGLPGIPLRIVHGEMNVTLLDSIHKKTAAVDEMVKRLDISGVRVLTGRAEEVGRLPAHTGSYDAVVARAVAPLVDLVRWSRPFLRRRGMAAKRLHPVAGERKEFAFPYLLALKGGELEKEIRDVRMRFGDVAITEIALVFPGSEALDLMGKKMIVVEFP